MSHANNERPLVLVVEDDKAVSRMLRLSLRSGGFDTTETETGGEALHLLDEKPFDAVVLDLGLPDGRGGAVLERLQAGHSPESPAWVVMSALDQPEATRRYGPIKGPFLAKPFDPWDLVKTLEDLISKKKA